MYGIAGFLGEFVPCLTYFPVQPRMPERMESDAKLVMTDSGRTAGLPEESSIFFLAVRMRLLNLRSPVESSKLPPVLKLRRAGKAQSFWPS